MEPYQEQLRTKGLAERTYLFPRYISSEEVPIFFKAADLLIQPYIRFSGQSGLTQTAYLHSVPVIATDVGGLPELVIHGRPESLFSREIPKDWPWPSRRFLPTIVKGSATGSMEKSCWTPISRGIE